MYMTLETINCLIYKIYEIKMSQFYYLKEETFNNG